MVQSAAKLELIPETMIDMTCSVLRHVLQCFLGELRLVELRCETEGCPGCQLRVIEQMQNDTIDGDVAAKLIEQPQKSFIGRPVFRSVHLAIVLVVEEEVEVGAGSINGNIVTGL